MGHATFVAIAAGAAVATVLLAGARSGQGDGPPSLADSRSLVLAPPFDRALRALEVPGEGGEFTDAMLDRRTKQLGELTRRVEEGGDELIAACVEVVLDGNDEDRRHAELLLAQVPQLPTSAVARLEGAPGFEGWALGLLHRRQQEDFIVDVLPKDPPWWMVPFPDPIKQVEADLRARLAFDGHEVAGFSEEFREAYQSEALPILDHLADHVDDREMEAVDLDGDDDPEVVVACRLWKESGFFEGLSFLALLDREGKAAPWRVVAFERIDDSETFTGTVQRDFDRDGFVEVAVRSCLMGCSGGTGIVRMVDRHCAERPMPFPELHSCKPSYRVVLVDRTWAEPTRFVTSDYHVQNETGTACEAVGALAWERKCFLWSGGAFVPAETLYVPLRW